MRRVDCLQCGLTVERVSWVKGKSETTRRYQWYLAGWAKRLARREVSAAGGRAHMKVDGIQALRIDKMPYGRGHQYLTAVYPIDGWNRRLVWVGEKRTVKTLLRFFRWLGEERSARSHRELIGNWFRARKVFSSGVVEGLNNQAKWTMKKAHGYKSFRTLEIALYQTLGRFIESGFIHRFLG